MTYKQILEMEAEPNLSPAERTALLLTYFDACEAAAEMPAGRPSPASFATHVQRLRGHARGGDVRTALDAACPAKGKGKWSEEQRQQLLLTYLELRSIPDLPVPSPAEFFAAEAELLRPPKKKKGARAKADGLTQTQFFPKTRAELLARRRWYLRVPDGPQLLGTIESADVRGAFFLSDAGELILVQDTEQFEPVPAEEDVPRPELPEDAVAAVLPAADAAAFQQLLQTPLAANPATAVPAGTVLAAARVGFPNGMSAIFELTSGEHRPFLDAYLLPGGLASINELQPNEEVFGAVLREFSAYGFFLFRTPAEPYVVQSPYPEVCYGQA